MSIDNFSRGTGAGFHQVESSYQKFSQPNEDTSKEINPLRQHASKMKEVGAEILRKKGAIYPERLAGVANPNPQSIEANRINKIYSPTRGGTAVQFLDKSDQATKKTMGLCRNIQNTLGAKFGRTTEADYRSNPDGVSGASIIPIENLHVTAIAMGVVDAKNEEEFGKRLEINDIYRACFKFLEQHLDVDVIHLNNPSRDVNADQFLGIVGASTDPLVLLESTLPPQLSAEIKQLVDTEKKEQSQKLISFLESGGAVFNISELKVTDNGSIVLQLAGNADLVQVKQGLVPLGGIAKGSLGNMTASTIGFIPNFDRISNEDKESMQQIINDFNTEIQTEDYTIRMDKLDFVSFKVNTLAPDVIQTTSIQADNQLDNLNFSYLP